MNINKLKKIKEFLSSYTQETAVLNNANEDTLLKEDLHISNVSQLDFIALLNHFATRDIDYNDFVNMNSIKDISFIMDKYEISY